MSTAENQCKYCGKGFRKESTLSAHLCEPKRRWQQETDTGVQLGLRAFLQFYVSTQGSAKSKSYKEFVESPYYSAFVKYGQYLVSIRAINPAKFTEWLLKNNKKLDQWTKEKFYDDYLIEHLRKEHPTDALERSLEELQRYSDEIGEPLVDIFRKGGKGKMCNLIVNGRISPWVIYNCDSGIEFLSSLNEEQISLIYHFITPDIWQRKLRDYLADSELIKHALGTSGL